ncbi:MFS transporter [Streptomyces albofaciens JCM 4342]|uniref:MFS transporter n=1 Tax=Streptomyces albofaciens TaxID=66866 RepID=UPI00123C69B7|nr:MFS transporter [Streptomyces albofaciens]KAA6224177.1 MFS transporter [Streptomyces albofaciens JCM 4342]
MAAVAIGGFCVQLDAFALNMALPVIRRDLHASAAAGPWVISAYLLAAGALMPAAGRLADVFGRRRLLVLGLALFGSTSAACALAPSLPFLVAAHVVQGVGGALVMPVGLALLTRSFPPGRARVATGYALGLAGLATACGPFVGGALTEAVSWRAVFWVNVPLCGAAVLCARRAPRSKDGTSPREGRTGGEGRMGRTDRTEQAERTGRMGRTGRVGWGRLVLGTGVPACSAMALESAGTWWDAGGWAAGALVLGVLFVRSERRSRAPLADHTLFRNGPYVALTSAGAVGNAATVVLLFVVPLTLQDTLGMSVLGAGTVFLLPAAVMAAAGPVAGRVPPHAAEQVMAASLGLAGAALGVLAALQPAPFGAVPVNAVLGGDSLLVLLPAATVAAAALGLAGALVLTATQAVVPPHRVGEASGLTKCAITVTAGLGLAPAGSAPVAALLGAAAGCATACLALLVRRRKRQRR